MRQLVLSSLLCALLLPAPAAHAQEPVFPAGLKITSTYTLSDTLLPLGDTLTATRQFTNDESFPIDGLYFTDCLPAELTVVRSSAAINGAAVPLLREGPLAGSLLPGYNTYRWIVDSPDNAITRSIAPGDRVLLTYQIVSSDIGRFSLPLHAAAGFGNGDGLFATSTEDTIDVLISLGADDDPADLLPTSPLRTLAYPNPFNAEVSIAFENVAAGTLDLRFEVFDILGRRVDLQLVHPTGRDGLIRWQPESSVGSGVFFYRLSDIKHTAGGKLLLLK